MYFDWCSTDFDNHINSMLKEHYTDLKFILNPRNSNKFNLTRKLDIHLFKNTLNEKGKMVSVSGDTGSHKSTSMIMVYIKQRLMIANYTKNIKGMLELNMKFPHLYNRFIEIKQEIDNKHYFNWDNIQYSNYELSKLLSETNKSLQYFIRDEQSKDFGENSRITADELHNQIEQQARKRVWNIGFCSRKTDDIPDHIRFMAYDYGKAYTKKDGDYLFDCTRFIVLKYKARKQMMVGYYIAKRLPKFIEDEYLRYNKEKRVGNETNKGSMFVNEKMKKYIYLVEELYPQDVIQDCINKVNSKKISKGEFKDILVRVCSRKLSTQMARSLITYLLEVKSFGGLEEWKALNYMK